MTKNEARLLLEGYVTMVTEGWSYMPGWVDVTQAEELEIVKKAMKDAKLTGGERDQFEDVLDPTIYVQRGEGEPERAFRREPRKP